MDVVDGERVVFVATARLTVGGHVDQQVSRRGGSRVDKGNFYLTPRHRRGRTCGTFGAHFGTGFVERGGVFVVRGLEVVVAVENSCDLSLGVVAFGVEADPHIERVGSGCEG